MADRMPCDICPKTFADKSGLSYHRMAHGGERKYNRIECNKLFISAAQLKNPFTHSHWGETIQPIEFFI